MAEEEDVVHESESIEPQITSDDPNERKLARRLRIQRRIEAAKAKLIKIQEEDDEAPEVEGKSLLEKHMRRCSVRILNLLTDGKGLVTNVRIANDAFEVKRRQDEAATKEVRMQKLDAEAVDALAKFQQINKKWEVIASYNDPLDIHEETEMQREKCFELINQKNAIIADLRTELKLADSRFIKNLEKQEEDTTLIVERIDKQIGIMRRAYRNELNLIESVIDIERKEMVEGNIKRWDVLYRQREKDEVGYLEQRFDLLEKHDELMTTVMVDHQEKFRATKIILENDIQVLQQELQQVKALCLLNSEKLDYNYQIVKKREEENLIIKTQQKRRLNKMQDVVTKLRSAIRAAESKMQSDMKRLRTEVMGLHKSIDDVQHKANHFATVNDKTYMQLWRFNEKKAKALLDQCLAIDRVLYEQHLGLIWTSPHVALLQLKKLPSYQMAIAQRTTEALNDNLSVASEGSVTKKKLSNKETLAFKLQSKRLVKHILECVADNSGFLLESRLLPLLEPYTNSQQTLVKIDNIFTALGLKCESDVERLKEFFLPYAHCELCNINKTESVAKVRSKSSIIEHTSSDLLKGAESMEKEGGSLEDTENIINKVIHFASDQTHVAQQVVHSETTETRTGSSLKSVSRSRVESLRKLQFKSHDDIDQDHFVEWIDSPAPSVSQRISFVEPDLESISSRISLTKNITPEGQTACIDPSHELLVDQRHILTALGDFMVATHPEVEEIVKFNCLESGNDTVSRLISEHDVELFWRCYRNVFLSEREKVWDGLLIGLNKYYSVLQDRHRLNAEVQQLESQNAELRHLLEQYIATPPKVRRKDLLKPIREFVPPPANSSTKETLKGSTKTLCQISSQVPKY